MVGLGEMLPRTASPGFQAEQDPIDPCLGMNPALGKAGAETSSTSINKAGSALEDEYLNPRSQ